MPAAMPAAFFMMNDVGGMLHNELSASCFMINDVGCMLHDELLWFHAS
jgi:hypothetical protein